jgi:hypothetical protein
MLSIFFFRKSCRWWDNVEKMWWSPRGHKWRHNMGRTRCMLDEQGYMYTHKYVVFIAFPRQQWFANAPQCYVIHTFLSCYILKGLDVRIPALGTSGPLIVKGLRSFETPRTAVAVTALCARRTDSSTTPQLLLFYKKWNETAVRMVIIIST